MSHLDHNLVALTEQITDWRSEGFHVRLEERVVSQVLLSGGTSKNGHRYSDAALRNAAALYERKPVFLDHAANLAKPYDRSMRDLAGWITEARHSDGRIQGEIQVLDTEAGRTLLALMTSETPAVGMSHVILAQKSTDGTVVEKIHDVISVDAVVFPATTTGFREQFDVQDHGNAYTEDAIRQEYERQLAELRGELLQVLGERNRLRQHCDDLVAENLHREVDRQLAASGLPAYSITDGLREQLRGAETAEMRSRLIAEHRDFVLRCRQRAPCSRLRNAPADDQSDTLTRQMVRAIQGRKAGVRR